MSKTVWIINQYASTPTTALGGRHYYLARELAKQGYKVYVIGSASHHLLREPPVVDNLFRLEKVDGFSFVWVKMPSYTGAHSKQRVLNWFLFPWRLRKLGSVIRDKPDAIFYSSPAPIGFLQAQRFAKKYGAKLIFEVRDIWPLTLTELGSFSRKHPFIRLMQWIEDKAYRDSDRVISNLKNSVEHMVERGLTREKFTWIPNGFSMDEVGLRIPLNPKTIEQLPKDKFIIGYTGTLGTANALDTLIETAEHLQDHPEVAFILVGGGKEKAALQRLASGKGLKNVHFIAPIPKVEVQDMLSRFDVCFIGWLDEALYRFGIGANKIPEYLYSGKPVLHAFSGAGDPVKEAGAGIQVPAESPEKLAAAVLCLLRMPLEERQAMGANGRKAAIEQYEYGQLAEKLANVLF